MKKFFITLLLLSFCTSFLYAERPDAGTLDQRAPITLVGSAFTLSNLIGEIENQTGYLFVYSEDDVNVNEVVSVDEGKFSVKDCLTKVLEVTGLKYFFENNYIILTKDEPNLSSITGRVIDAKTKQPLVFASIRLAKNRISNVSNGEGFFSLKFPTTFENDSVQFSFIGYQTVTYAVKDLLQNTSRTIALDIAPLDVPELVVRPDNAESIVMMAISNISDNYPNHNMQMTGFYREMIKKGNNFVTLTEAALDINKASYVNPYAYDQAGIFKGRGSVDWSKIDTVFVKFRGGINSSFETDLMKYPLLGVEVNEVPQTYDFAFLSPAILDGANHYVISFTPKSSIHRLLFAGKLYINMSNLSLVRAEFNISFPEDRAQEAASLFITRKPRELKAKLQYANYLIQYKEYNGKSVFDYTRTEVKFDAKWSGKLFKNTYTIISEMAITDRSDVAIKIDPERRVKNRDIVLDKVSDFTDDAFWKDYNVIEPESGIENVISKIIKQLNKKETK